MKFLINAEMTSGNCPLLKQGQTTLCLLKYKFKNPSLLYSWEKSCHACILASILASSFLEGVPATALSLISNMFLLASHRTPSFLAKLGYTPGYTPLFMSGFSVVHLCHTTCEIHLIWQMKGVIKQGRIFLDWQSECSLVAKKYVGYCAHFPIQILEN